MGFVTLKDGRIIPEGGMFTSPEVRQGPEGIRIDTQRQVSSEISLRQVSERSSSVVERLRGGSSERRG